jgi:membrane fusion protein (multidrug efflux system)
MFALKWPYVQRTLQKRSAPTAFAFVAVVALASCDATRGVERSSNADPPQVGIITVATEPVTLTTELPGRTTPYVISEVRPQVTGLIRARLFREGGDVHAGDALYQIDPAPFQSAYNIQKAALARAEANSVAVKLKAARYAELIKTHVVSQQDYNDVVAIAGQGAADVEAAKAMLESARINLANTRVSAPISGRVGASTVTSGALVTANQAASLTTIQTLDPIYVDLAQSSADLLRLRREFGAGFAEAKIKLTLEDGSMYPLEGVLRFSDVTVDSTTGSVTLRALFPNPDGVLLPGMFVRASLPQAQAASAVLAPQSAITRDALGQAMAWVVGIDDKVETRAVTAPRTIGAQWLVTSGLNSGDRLVVDGLQNIKSGMVVRFTQASLASSPAVATLAP